MKIILLTLFCVFLSCKKDTSVASSASSARSCPVMTLDDLEETHYSGQITMTSGNCGEIYTVHGDVLYGLGSSITGYRFVTAYLQTTSGNINFSSGGRWQTAGSLTNEGGGLSFTGVDHTTCQNALAINGSEDIFTLTLTAEFDSNCNPRLRGTFREYSRCVDNSEIDICSGTVILIK